jgi:hypothetical protein
MDDFEFLDDCWGKWEKLAPAKRNRNQQAVVDVCGTITDVEGDGVLSVWRESAVSMDRIVDSFRMAGALDIARLLEESSFCKEILNRTSPDADDWNCTQEEENKLRDIDLRIGELGPDAREGLLEFLPERKS